MLYFIMASFLKAVEKGTIKLMIKVTTENITIYESYFFLSIAEEKQ